MNNFLIRIKLQIFLIILKIPSFIKYGVTLFFFISLIIKFISFSLSHLVLPFIESFSSYCMNNTIESNRGFDLENDFIYLFETDLNLEDIEQIQKEIESLKDEGLDFTELSTLLSNSNSDFQPQLFKIILNTFSKCFEPLVETLDSARDHNLDVPLSEDQLYQFNSDDLINPKTGMKFSGDSEYVHTDGLNVHHISSDEFPERGETSSVAELETGPQESNLTGQLQTLSLNPELVQEPGGEFHHSSSSSSSSNSSSTNSDVGQPDNVDQPDNIGNPLVAGGNPGGSPSGSSSSSSDNDQLPAPENFFAPRAANSSLEYHPACISLELYLDRITRAFEFYKKKNELSLADTLKSLRHDFKERRIFAYIPGLGARDISDYVPHVCIAYHKIRKGVVLRRAFDVAAACGFKFAKRAI